MWVDYYIDYLLHEIGLDKESFKRDTLHEKLINEFCLVFDCISEGVFVTDGEGRVLALNEASEKLCDWSRDEMIGKTFHEMIRDGYFKEEEICTLKAMDTKEIIHVIQQGKSDRYDLLVTSAPYMENGKVHRVISTERDVTLITELEEQTKKVRELAKQYERELAYYRDKEEEEESINRIIYRSAEMHKSIEAARKVAKSDVSVLLQGESGVGKEVIARLIYSCSLRKNKPLVSINCAAIPDNLLESELFGYEKGSFTGASIKGKIGIFELANEGTLFLDEIGALPIHLQSKILRAIQEKEIMRLGATSYIPIDVRIISATNINLKDAIDNNTFREDLFYRINVVPIAIKPLRERKEDIVVLAKHFLEVFNNKYHVNKMIQNDAWSIILKYDWPGNVRELENVIERLVITSRDAVITGAEMGMQFSGIEHENLDFLPGSHKGFKESVREYEKNLIKNNLQLFKNCQELADAIGIDKSTLTRKMQRYNIENPFNK